MPDSKEKDKKQEEYEKKLSDMASRKQDCLDSG